MEYISDLDLQTYKFFVAMIVIISTQIIKNQCIYKNDVCVFYSHRCHIYMSRCGYYRNRLNI